MKKKLFALVLAVLLPIGLLAGSGDVNGDGKIDAADIVEIVKFWQGKQSGLFNFDRADVNNDGELDQTDVEAIASRIMVGASPIDISTHEISITDSHDWQFFKIVLTSKSREALENIEWRLSDECKDWIQAYASGVEPSGEYFIMEVYLDVEPNLSSWSRDGEVIFNNLTHSFRESVKIHTESYIRLPKSELHIANQEDCQVMIPIESNLSPDIIGDFYCEVVGEGCDWIRPSGGSFEYDNNETGKIREALILVKNDKYNFSETIKIIHHPAQISIKSKLYNILACQPSGDIVEIPVSGGDESFTVGIYADNFAEDDRIVDYVTRLPDEIRNGTQYVRLKVSENESVEDRHADFYVKLGDGSPYWFHLLQAGINAPSFEEQMEALEILYKTTNGKQWRDNTNWLSNKPINEWYGVNTGILGNYVISLQISDNNLSGEMPSELSKLMPHISSFPYFGSSYQGQFDLENNYLYGKIPESVKHHPSWNTVGWQTVIQNGSADDSGLFEYDGFNLRSKDSKLEYMVEEENGVDNAFDIIHNNDLTWVYFAGDICPNWAFFTGISDNQINLFMDYQNKGLGMVVVTGKYWDYPWEPFIEYALNKQEDGMPKTIHWLKDSIGSIEPHLVGTNYLLDREGNLVQVFSGSCTSESYCLPKIDSVCRARLGTPEEHEKFVSEYYTSTDYSKDGEVTKMQSATVGDGIDVVFVGEAYLDTEMGEGGVYEQTMQEAMESFFSEEPYKSLRNRFNIYAVKAVSPNDTYVDGVTELAIGGSIEKAFEYAKKAVGERDDRLMVGVICKPGAIAERSQCFMFEEDGSFAAWMFTGTGKYVLSHEMGGHGVAFLLDEYVENGWEESYPDEERKAYLDEMYTQYGEGANVDWRDDPAQVRWTHFINDSRYAAENIGVYEGACLYGKGCFRPTENSMMRYNDCGFNAPSREAIYKRVMKLSEGDDWEYDYETFVAFDAPAREAYKAAQSRSESRGTSAQQRRIESRPPTIYKGTWRDAGKCEKVEYSVKSK